MPVIGPSNNRILPANSRAADVAEKAVQEITPVQQTRMQNAFRVQGAQGILYSRLSQGTPCSCNASRLNLNARLGKDGKASEGKINEILSGALSDIENYAQCFEPSITSPSAGNKHLGENQTHAESTSLVIPLFDSESVKDDGPARPETLDDMFANFDLGVTGFSDVACPVCFGSGFVGGYAPMNTWRHVLPCNSPLVQMDDEGQINVKGKPWSALSSRIQFMVHIPHGVCGIDAFRVLNGRDPVNAIIRINGYTADYNLVLSCRGLTVTVDIDFGQSVEWTHIEIQMPVSKESAYFELPKQSQSGDLTLLESTVPFQVLLSPNIPHVERQDVIVESKTGKALVVGEVSPWSTLQRLNLGFEVQVRVSQPYELFTLLPKRGPIQTKNKTTVGVHDNQRGTYRT